MTDYKKLVEALRIAADHAEAMRAATTWKVVVTVPLLRKAADAIEELFSTCEHFRIAADDWFKEAGDYKEKLAKCEEELQRVKTTDSIYGYPVNELIAFATACRRNGVEEKDLKTFANNAEFAYRAVEAETMAAFERAVLGGLGGQK